MLSAADIVRLDAQAVRASVGVVALAGPAELGWPTPCGDWTLAGLLAHMTAQHNGFAAAAAGHGADLVRWQTGAPAADPVPEYAAAAMRAHLSMVSRSMEKALAEIEAKEAAAKR